MSTEHSTAHRAAEAATQEPRVFDAWINLPYAPGEVTPDPSVVARFKRGNSAYEGGQTMTDVVAEMDRLGISGGVLTKVPRDITPPYVHGTKTGEAVLRETCERLAKFQAEYPGRFVTSVGIDPRLGYEAAKHVRIAVREYGIKCIRVVPMFTGIAIDDKLAFPMYTAACDEGAVVSINVGVPGPMKPAKLQRTILIDEVALTFPELKIVMSHLGDPWISETVSMLVKHPNVFAMTAGWAPKYVPEDILAVARKRNKTKLMWASDYPILPFDRTITEGRALELPDDSRRNYLGANALAVFGEPPAGTGADTGTGD
ncbi:amidohydrolase family protein [Nocardia sp. NPDC047038]|uniref:amidohydrolase family protein n=1 Tax=Nocardia sp. NPDC047038 TaxID=3154338 RepID=UPI00340807B9